MTVLVSYAWSRRIHFYLTSKQEFLISDLALSCRSIPSFTLSSISLLSPLLDSHPPSAIITHADFLPHLLELVYDTREGSHHTIIVVGSPGVKVGQGLGQVRILAWEDILNRGAQSPAAELPPPGLHSFVSPTFAINLSPRSQTGFHSFIPRLLDGRTQWNPINSRKYHGWCCRGKGVVPTFWCPLSIGYCRIFALHVNPLWPGCGVHCSV